MKNIAIFGASRSGKSTLAKMICDKYPNYHIIIGDAVRKAFSDILPNNNINNNGGEGMLEDFPRFLACMFRRSIIRSDENFNYIIDSCDISPKKAKELFEGEDTLIIFLGFPNQSEEEHIEQIKKYEKKTDWTYNKSIEDIKKHSKQWVKKSKEFENECNELGLWFVDTSFNREDILKSVFDKLEKLVG